jgi:hypothetical protein
MSTLSVFLMLVLCVGGTFAAIVAYPLVGVLVVFLILIGPFLGLLWGIAEDIDS